MAFKLAVANRVAVVVKGKLPGETRGTHINFDFTLDMARIDQSEVDAAHTSGEGIVDFLVAKGSGWSGQRLVVDEAGNPAPYSEEAFRALLNGVPGMHLWIYRAYMRDLGAQEKN
ncbi:MAG TPA: hypothetical protein VIL30_17980 [Ramlibacter sp.]|jgi:hypothetical protein